MNFATLKIGSWDLSGLVKDPAGAEFAQFLDSIEDKVKAFEGKRQSLRPDIPAPEFEGMVHDLEDIYEKLSIAGGYAHLRYYSNTASNEASALVTRMDKMSAEAGNRLLFFDLWFKKELDEGNAKRLIESMPAVYSNYLRHKRLLAKHSLSEPEERIINTLEVTGTGALVKIYDKMTSAFEFEMSLKRGRKKKTITKKFDNKEKLVSLVRSANPAEREAAYRALFATYRKNSGVLGEIYQNIVVEWRNEGISMRGYRTPISVRNIANNLDDETVGALLQACRKNNKVFQEYFREKARLLGVRKLRRYDLYAPLSTKRSGKKFAYGKAVASVLDTFGDFHPQVRALAERVFSEHHVDSEIRRAKRGGAFCHTVSPSTTPYVLLNFDGRTRDVSTLAHEFGHAIHSMLAEKLPITVSHAPLPLAETASVFAEMLLNERLMEKMSRQERQLLLAEQIDDMYATIMRQAYFTLFEVDAHRAIGEKNATIDQVTQIYTENLKEQFGDSVVVSPEFGWEWIYIPHFYHTPFYCYAYSFGNLLVLSLYQQYKVEGKPFVPKYLGILAAGGSRKPEELLKESGLDITREEFWQQGFDLVGEKIQQLKGLASK
ncbi:oligoendopeptidase, pepF/M3 family [Candidatus Nitrososphaera evergladensis SR1]|uniref:Oligoendopeptidase, pepF/M3 family n=1 Tax=Candidatus Nitrososphaera evergladensis SR1 TaxID=1459636 RepID=A0A075MWV8_9ARCH|nr:M3 family oligoendopeptidase [Candidatus Nitrososphaera evergladensis]AIF85137.1 oligoendopeptidase, pepF/M3 family [Candidatus Nitrososphaera evergladensis SR1]